VDFRCRVCWRTHRRVRCHFVRELGFYYLIAGVSLSWSETRRASAAWQQRGRTNLDKESQGRTWLDSVDRSRRVAALLSIATGSTRNKESLFPETRMPGNFVRTRLRALFLLQFHKQQNEDRPNPDRHGKLRRLRLLQRTSSRKRKRKAEHCHSREYSKDQFAFPGHCRCSLVFLARPTSPCNPACGGSGHSTTESNWLPGDLDPRSSRGYY
jgi:hypothetical protein